jgi:5-methylcytosine-specific restriction endonuclease McrA
MRIINKNDEYLRRAIFKVYGGKCFYTGNPIEYIDMQLDHIIPESMEDDREQLDVLIKLCGLGEGFELNSLINLVPTNRLENRRKSDILYKDSSIMHYFEQTSKNVHKIEKEITKLKKHNKFEENLSGVKASIDNDYNGKEKERAIERLIDYINNEETVFSRSDEIYAFENMQIYKRYTERVGIEAVLPRYDNCETECIIYFKTLKLRDCKVMLDNETILKELFSGIFTEPKHGIRRFIEHHKNVNVDLIAEDLENAVIRLGNNKLKLGYNDICLLCKVIDSYAKVYLTKIKEIEEALKSRRFPISKRRNSYKFLAITAEQWYNMVKFANKQDVAKGSTAWHIFDSNPSASYIKVYTEKKHELYEPGYHSFFLIEKDEDSVFYPTIASTKYVVTWQFIEDIDKRGVQYINSRENWDAEYAYNWFINEFIPKANVKYKMKNFFNRDELELNDLLENNKIEFFKYINKNEVMIESNLHMTTSALQAHFHRRPQNKYRIKKESFIEFYASVVSFLKISKKVDRHYISSKIGIGKCSSVCEMVNEIEELMKTSNEKTITGFDIDNMFRALLLLFKDNNFALDKGGVTNIMNQLEEFVEIFNRETLLDKYAVRYLAW